MQTLNFHIPMNTAIYREDDTRDDYLCVKKVNMYVPSFWDLSCAAGISLTTIKDDPDVLIAPMVTKSLFARTPFLCDTSSKVTIIPFKDNYNSYWPYFAGKLITVKYAPLTYSDKSNPNAPIERKVDCNTIEQFDIYEHIKEDISNKQKELKRLDNCVDSRIDSIQYFYYQEDEEKLSTIPNVKVTSDGVDASISVTYGGKELDGVNVELKVHGAKRKSRMLKWKTTEVFTGLK